MFEAVSAALARGDLSSALNPGHLTGHDEWIHTPIRPGSAERIASGMPFQVDIIPTPLPAGWALNCEDGVVFADDSLSAELKARHPAAFDRIEARRRFVRDRLGVAIRNSILPLSSTPVVSAAVLAGAGPAPGAILRFAVALVALSIWRSPPPPSPGLEPGRRWQPDSHIDRRRSTEYILQLA